MKIVLADDHDVVREGLRTLLERNPSLSVTAEAEDGASALQIIREHKPDLAIIDVAMPRMSGIDVTRQIKGELPHTKILALSMHCDRRFVLEMLRAGASGYVLKNRASKELLEAIETICAGRVYLSPTIVDIVVQDFAAQDPDIESSVFHVLTKREREVLQLMAEGHTSKEIAGMLHVSVKTVDTHRMHVMQKLKIDSMAGLTKYAIREGLTTSDS